MLLIPSTFLSSVLLSQYSRLRVNHAAEYRVFAGGMNRGWGTGWKGERDLHCYAVDDTGRAYINGWLWTYSQVADQPVWEWEGKKDCWWGGQEGRVRPEAGDCRIRDSWLAKVNHRFFTIVFTIVTIYIYYYYIYSNTIGFSLMYYSKYFSENPIVLL